MLTPNPTPSSLTPVPSNFALFPHRRLEAQTPALTLLTSTQARSHWDLFVCSIFTRSRELQPLQLMTLRPSFTLSHTPPFISPAASTSALQHTLLGLKSESMQTAKKRYHTMQEDRTDFGEQAQDCQTSILTHFTQPTPFLPLSVHHPLCFSTPTFSAPFPDQCLGPPVIRGEVQVNLSVRGINGFSTAHQTAQLKVSFFLLSPCLP